MTSPPDSASSSSTFRKGNKPLLEKKRRARINSSLEELKSLVLSALNKDSSKFSKLEKADILELTVKHLKEMQQYQMKLAATRDPGVLARYRAGFNECAHEVDRYLAAIDGLKPELRLRMMSHLAQAVDVSVNDVSSSLHYQQQQQQENPCMASPPYLLPANMTSLYDSQSRCSFSATSPPIVYNKTVCDSPAEVSTTSLGSFRQLSEFSDSSNDCENLPPKQQPRSSAAGTIFRKSSSSSAMRRSSSFEQRNSREQFFSPLSENRQILPLGLLSGNSNNTLCSVSNSYDNRPNNNSGGVNSAFKPLNSAGIKNEPMWRPW